MEFSLKELEEIAFSGEGQTREFKAMLDGINPKALAQTFVAFANTDGGDLFIGISDDGKVIGINPTTITFDHILNAAREICQPSLEIQIQTLSLGKKSVLKIRVERSLLLHSLSNGMVYIRVGSQDKRLIGEDIARLASAKSLVSFEDKAVTDAQMIDLDLDLIHDLKQAPANVQRMRHFNENEVLKTYHLVNDKEQLTIAAILLFAKNPSKWLFDSGGTFIRFANEQVNTSHEGKIDYLDRQDFSLPLVPLIDALIEKITTAITKGAKVVGPRRSELWEYPLSVYRECIVNAVVHRNYQIPGARMEVRVYEDHLEFRSPGSLPGFMTLETLGTRHYPRNPKLLRCLLDWGYVESLGMGIAHIKKTLFENGFPPPEWHNFPDEFRVVIRKQLSSHPTKNGFKELTPMEQKTLHYLYQNNFIDRQSFIELHHISVPQAKAELRRLVDKGILKLEKKGPASRYVLD